MIADSPSSRLSLRRPTEVTTLAVENETLQIGVMPDSLAHAPALLLSALLAAAPLSAQQPPAQRPPARTLLEDVIHTSAGDLTITFVGHGTLMFRHGGKVIHVDPVGREADYSRMPKADLRIARERIIVT